MRALRASALLAVAGALAASPPPQASGADELCLLDDPPAPTAPRDLRFGITPGIAGSAGVEQGAAHPVRPARERSALRQLRVPRRSLVLRLNRLFWADGAAAIGSFARRVDRYWRLGLESEVQIRFHPPAGREGDLTSWARFVAAATRRLARRPGVVALSITNEINFPVSPNTSDGSYPRALEGLVRGVRVADRVLRRIGRRDVDVGFSVAWRWLPTADAALWERLGELADRRFRRGLDYVGVQAYPGLVWPPVALPGRSAGEEVAEALTLLRRCYMPKARLGRRVDLWVSENGYATKPVLNTESGQAANLASTVDWVAGVARPLNVTDYRYFNLRDNDSNGIDLFAQVGLLRDDYSPKPAFGEYRRLIRRFGR